LEPVIVADYTAARREGKRALGGECLLDGGDGGGQSGRVGIDLIQEGDGGLRLLNSLTGYARRSECFQGASW
jgi:hypothetical protein